MAPKPPNVRRAPAKPWRSSVARLLGTREGEHRVEQHVRTSLDVRWRRELFWAVTAALSARHEDHSDVGDARHDLGIVNGPAEHLHSREPATRDDPVEERLQ